MKSGVTCLVFFFKTPNTIESKGPGGNASGQTDKKWGYQAVGVSTPWPPFPLSVNPHLTFSTATTYKHLAIHDTDYSYILLKHQQF